MNILKKKQPDFKWSVKFSKQACYQKTQVKISINCNFTKLHYLYKLPILILKAYWSMAFTRPNNIFPKDDFDYLLEVEKTHSKEVPDFSEIKFNETSFPHIIPTRKKDPFEADIVPYLFR